MQSIAAPAASLSIACDVEEKGYVLTTFRPSTILIVLLTALLSEASYASCVGARNFKILLNEVIVTLCLFSLSQSIRILAMWQEPCCHAVATVAIISFYVL